MNLRHHRIPAGVFAALAAGHGGAGAIRQLAMAQHSKHLLFVRGVPETARAAGHPEAAMAWRAYDLLADLEQRRPEAVDAVLRHPAVGAWAGLTVQALLGGDLSARPGVMAALAAAAAIRSGTGCVIEVPVAGGLVTLPSLGQARIRGHHPVAMVRCMVEGAEISAGEHRVRVPADPHEDAPGWQGLRRLTADAAGLDLRLLIDDLDPYRMPATSVAGRLTDEEADHWRAALSDAWRVLAGRHRTTATEIRAAIRVLTPLPTRAEGGSSATSRETFGSTALSPPPDGRTLAVTLAHEVQHTKLAALLDVVPLTGPDTGVRYYAPWRDDPRPASGLLQGTYAYLGVSGFWRRQRHSETGATAIRAHAEFARWRDAARQAAETMLGSGGLTRAGETFVAGMLRTLRIWSTEEVPSPAMSIAIRDAEEHRARWRRRNGARRPP